MPGKSNWNLINQNLIQCVRCPRLIDHCQTTASTKRRSFQNDEYWGKPVPNFGDPLGRLLIVGLAPAAHGANRTGRMFTGDRSGDFLFEALHKTGFANQSQAVGRNDGLELKDCSITAVCHCAPPQNKPTTSEIQNCSFWLQQTIESGNHSGFFALGGLAWEQMIRFARSRNWFSGKKPGFGHGAFIEFETGQWMIGSYHPSQQNTFTGKLTQRMLREVLRKARKLL